MRTATLTLLATDPLGRALWDIIAGDDPGHTVTSTMLDTSISWRIVGWARSEYGEIIVDLTEVPAPPVGRRPEI